MQLLVSAREAAAESRIVEVAPHLLLQLHHLLRRLQIEHRNRSVLSLLPLSLERRKNRASDLARARARRDGGAYAAPARPPLDFTRRSNEQPRRELDEAEVEEVHQTKRTATANGGTVGRGLSRRFGHAGFRFRHLRLGPPRIRRRLFRSSGHDYWIISLASFMYSDWRQVGQRARQKLDLGETVAILIWEGRWG